MPKLPLLDDLIDLNGIQSIKSNKIHNFLNKCDKNKNEYTGNLINYPD